MERIFFTSFRNLVIIFLFLVLISFRPGKTAPEIIIKNSADYSEKFITGLKKLNYQKIELKDSLIIFDDADTSYFPPILKANKRIMFTGIMDTLAIALTVERLNYTTLKYYVEMVKFGKAKHNYNGQAEIDLEFLLNKDPGKNKKVGFNNSVLMFSDSTLKDCGTTILVGNERALIPYLAARLQKNCNGKIRDIPLEYFTILYQKI